MNYFVDTFLAAIFISTEAVAAVGIVMPIVCLFNAIAGIFVSGCSIHYSQVLGRGRHRRAQEVYTIGIQATAVVGVFFWLLCNMLAEPLVKVFGASDADVIRQAALYLRVVSFSIPTTAVSELVIRGLSMYGLNKASISACSVRLFGNIGLSIMFVSALPYEMKIIGLALGTIIASVLGTLFAVFLKSQNRFGLSVIKYKPRFAEIKAMFMTGLSTGLDYLASAVSGAVMNNLIGASELGTSGIAVYAAVNSVFNLALCPGQAMMMTGAPLYGMLFGAADKKALKRSFLLCLKNALVYSLFFCLALEIVLSLTSISLVSGGAHVSKTAFYSGVRLSYLAVFPMVIIYSFANLFELTDRTPDALAVEILPDSVLMVLSTAILLKLGYGMNSIWISYTLSALLFIIAYAIHTKIKYRQLSLTRLMRLNKWSQNVEQDINVSIQDRNSDIAKLTKTVHDFLNDGNASKKTAYMTALCMDELASDIAAHTRHDSKSHNAIMDIKLLSLKDEFRIIIRNIEKPYNPLDFELDKETFSKVGVTMAQKLASKISYQYLYNMNIITIYIQK